MRVEQQWGLQAMRRRWGLFFRAVEPMACPYPAHNRAFPSGGPLGWPSPDSPSCLVLLIYDPTLLLVHPNRLWDGLSPPLLTGPEALS